MPCFLNGLEDLRLLPSKILALHDLWYVVWCQIFVEENFCNFRNYSMVTTKILFMDFVSCYQLLFQNIFDTMSLALNIVSYMSFS